MQTNTQEKAMKAPQQLAEEVVAILSGERADMAAIEIATSIITYQHSRQIEADHAALVARLAAGEEA